MIDPNLLAEQFSSKGVGNGMEILKLIQKWKQGCKFAVRNPLECPACTERLINNIEKYESVAMFSGCITPKFYLVVDRLREIHDESVKTRADMSLVDNKDLGALLNEFFRLGKELRLLKPHIYVDAEDDRRRT